MTYLGDFAANANVVHRFTTRSNSTSVPTAWAGANLLVYAGNANANVSDGITLANGTQTGVNVFTVATAANATFYTTGRDYDVVASTGTVGGSSVIGEVIASFSIENRVVARVTGNISGSILGGMNGNVAGTVGNVVGTPNINVQQWLGVAPQQLGAANGVVINGVNGGNITQNIVGNMTGSVGSMNGNVGGNVLGNMNGNVGGNIAGNVAGTVANITGTPNVGTAVSVTGNVAGVTGSVGGNVAGNLVGNIQGNLQGMVGNANAVEVGVPIQLALRYTAAAAAGNLTGGNTLVTVMTGVTNSTTRLTAAVEANGNTRTVTYS